MTQGQIFVCNSILLTYLEFNYTMMDFLCPRYWFLIDFEIVYLSGLIV